MMEFGRAFRYNGHRVVKYIIDMAKIKYRVKMDGAMLYEEFDTPQQAMEAASIYFAMDARNQKAEIIKYTANSVGLVMRNKTRLSKI